MQVLSAEEIIKSITTRNIEPWEQTYLAHYSSYWDGISKDPRVLLIPVDDHLVHRGDGVFEAFRTIKNKFYLLENHLERLRISAEAIGLKVPWTNIEFVELLTHLSQAANESELIFRLFVSRGSGSFTTNPYDCPRSHLTVVACRFKAIPLEKYQNGVSLGRSIHLQKPEPYSSIKSCNYLPNVLMKKEAVDRNIDFVVSFNAKNFLAESSTENVMILADSNVILYPPFGTILKGTTLQRSLELAKSHLQLPSRQTDITEEMLLNAKEVFLVGTTLDLLPVARYEGRTFKVGPVGQALRQLILDDQS
jgi:branched-chain amino acid aminotransferase